MCDCPGSSDTRSEETKLAISLNFEYIVKKSNKKKIVIVVSYDQLIGNRGELFKGLI